MLDFWTAKWEEKTTGITLAEKLINNSKFFNNHVLQCNKILFLDSESVTLRNPSKIPNKLRIKSNRRSNKLQVKHANVLLLCKLKSFYRSIHLAVHDMFGWFICFVRLAEEACIFPYMHRVCSKLKLEINCFRWVEQCASFWMVTLHIMFLNSKFLVLFPYSR